MQGTTDNSKLFDQYHKQLRAFLIWPIENAEEWQGHKERQKIFNNLIYQYIDIYQQLEFHRNVSETILAYSTDIPCKYNFANVKTPSLFPPPPTHWHRHEKSKQNLTLLEKIHEHKQGTNKLN